MQVRFREYTRNRREALEPYCPKWLFSIPAAVIFTVVVLIAFTASAEKKFEQISREQAQEMLETAQADIQANYYDPTMHGLNLKKTFERARQETAVAASPDELLLDIAGAVAALRDSHTRFMPPARPYWVDYGWLIEAIGDSDCYITAVRPGSDAAEKGLRAGDLVLSVNGVKINRQSLNYVQYGYRVAPQSGLRIAVRSFDGTERTVLAMAKITPGQTVIRRADIVNWLRRGRDRGDSFVLGDRSRYFKFKKQVLFWKLPDFWIDSDDVNKLLDRLRPYETVVFDLRGNSGGSEDALGKLIGGFFDHDVEIGNSRSRKGSTPIIAKSQGDKAFTGKLITLVDSKSASAAEIFARVIQLEKRGTVLGDRSAGAVMKAQTFVHALKLTPVTSIQYVVEVSVGDLTMEDGKSLENAGVQPDERILPTPEDLVSGLDPVMARAAQLAGMELTADRSGHIFRFEWPREGSLEID